MSGEPPQSESLRRLEQLAQVVDQLACPACQSALRLDAAALLCTSCGRRYPIVEGIPVLIATPAMQE